MVHAAFFLLFYSTPAKAPARQKTARKVPSHWAAWSQNRVRLCYHPLKALILQVFRRNIVLNNRPMRFVTLVTNRGLTNKKVYTILKLLTQTYLEHKMPNKKIYPVKSTDEKADLVFGRRADRDLFLESVRGKTGAWRALKPRNLMRFDQDAQKAAPILTAVADPKPLLNDHELADVLARLRTYKHGPNAEERDGATITLQKSAGSSRDYVAPGGYAPNYPRTSGAVITASLPARKTAWFTRLSRPSVRAGSASIIVRLTGDHLPPGTPKVWVANKIANKLWRVSSGNPYVYEPDEHDPFEESAD